MVKAKPYTEEHIIWLKENYKKYGKHRITKAFNEAFNDSRTMDSVWWKVQKLGLTGNGAEYKAEMCKKHFSVPIGSEHINSQGYTLIKVKDDKNGKSKNWKTKQSVIWEQAYGEIPKGYKVLFLDGDITNFDLENLICVPNSRISTLSKKKWFSKNPELTKAAIVWCELFSLTKEADLMEGYQDEILHVYPSMHIDKGGVLSAK